jgi:hypothetical protein
VSSAVLLDGCCVELGVVAGAPGVVECAVLDECSNHDREPIDPPSPHWLGHHARAPQIRSSGLWNVSHTTDTPNTEFLDILATTISQTA